MKLDAEKWRGKRSLLPAENRKQSKQHHEFLLIFLEAKQLGKNVLSCTYVCIQIYIYNYIYIHSIMYIDMCSIYQTSLHLKIIPISELGKEHSQAAALAHIGLSILLQRFMYLAQQCLTLRHGIKSPWLGSGGQNSSDWTHEHVFNILNTNLNVFESRK